MVIPMSKRFINQVEALRAQLERATVRDQDLDREVAADWFGADQESWQRLDEPQSPGKPSTSRRPTRR